MSETTTTRKRGPKWPPDPLLAAALVLYADRPHLTLDQLPSLLQDCAKRGGFARWAENPPHPTTIKRWAERAREIGLTPERAAVLFQGLKKEEGI